tara:strand:+ start:288 stop:1127 length:840 start_codon:yes stop_codon:yes gene_type:complete
MKSKLIYVYDLKKLDKVINFLQLGYNWSIKRSIEIRNYFEKHSSSAPMAAYTEENGDLKIAILLFDQTNYLNYQKKILSLCSWYAEPSERGMPALNFAETLTKDLVEYTITNYSPNYVAYKIWKSVGWVDMDVTKIQLGLQKKSPFINFKNENIIFDFSFRKKFLFKEIENFPTKKNNNEIYYVLKKIRINKKFFNINIIDIFLDKKEVKKIPFWSFLFILIKFRCVKINIHTNSNTYIKKLDWDKNEINWLVKSTKDSKEFILPVGSERCIKTGIEKM